ncbi:MAG: biopolymer transporter ExbD [Treponema sp.]|nr:biopolymer transporter ExbD [Treponema sp.]MCL2236719.1 biopolymer transporter ExbD [Treponema sp.]
MKISRRKKYGFLETCAASDLAFLLIIYFLVIAGFNINKGYIMNLPAKDSTRMIMRDDLLRFEMTETGEIVHSGEIIPINRARSLIASSQRENPNLSVIISIDSNAEWQRVVHFVEIAQDLQVDSFSFSMKKEDEL